MRKKRGKSQHHTTVSVSLKSWKFVQYACSIFFLDKLCLDVACGPQLSRLAPCQWALGHTHVWVKQPGSLCLPCFHMSGHGRSAQQTPVLADMSILFQLPTLKDNETPNPFLIWPLPSYPDSTQPNLQKLQWLSSQTNSQPLVSPCSPHLQALNMLFLWHHLPLSSSQVS